MDRVREIENQLNHIDNQIKDIVLDDLKPGIEAEFEVRILKEKRDLIIQKAISAGFIPTWEQGSWKLAGGVLSTSSMVLV